MPCKRSTYELQLEKEVYVERQGLGLDNATVANLFLGVSDPYLTVREEFLVYDIASFLADCAGMGGIMLGASLLATYDWLWRCALALGGLVKKSSDQEPQQATTQHQ